jgi:hypothetical protein
MTTSIVPVHFSTCFCYAIETYYSAHIQATSLLFLMLLSPAIFYQMKYLHVTVTLTVDAVSITKILQKSAGTKI